MFANPKQARTLEPVLPILRTMVTLARRRTEPGPPVLPDELQRLRMEVRAQLVAAREGLEKSMSERDAYLVLFPVVVHLDELVQTLLQDNQRGVWPLLQRDLFDTDRGGELFYATLDEILEGTALPIVVEVYAFCLRLGFRGKLLGDEEGAAAVIQRVSARLADDIEPSRMTEPEEVPRLQRARSALWYYLGAAIIIALLWYGLTWMAEKDRERLARRPDVPASVALPARGGPA